MFVCLSVCLCVIWICVLRKVQGLTGKTSSHTVCIQQARKEGLVTPEKILTQILTQLYIGAVEPFSVHLIHFVYHKQADGACP